MLTLSTSLIKLALKASVGEFLIAVVVVFEMILEQPELSIIASVPSAMEIIIVRVKTMFTIRFSVTFEEVFTYLTVTTEEASVDLTVTV